MNPSERRILPSRKKNLHHPLAESLGGRRTVAINAQEHDAYHYSLGHQPPCMGIRRLLYAAIKRNGFSVTIETATQLCETLTPLNWRDLYKADAFYPYPPPPNERARMKAAIAAFHLRRYLDTERAEIINAIGRLSGLEESHGMKNAMNFFRVSNPLTAIHRMVSEQVGKKHKPVFKWVDPMKESVRHAVEALTEKLEVERLSRTRREMMIALLNIQDSRIAEYQTSAAPSLREYSDILAKLGDRGRVDMSQFD